MPSPDNNKNNSCRQLLRTVLLLSFCMSIQGALLPGNPGNIPLTSCNRRCLDTFTRCFSFYDTTSHQCQLLAVCTQSCHRETVANRRSQDIVEDKISSSTLMDEYKELVTLDSQQSEKKRRDNNELITLSLYRRSGSKREMKRECLSDCDAEKYMCTQISDSVVGVYMCNRSNSMCRRKCGLF